MVASREDFTPQPLLAVEEAEGRDANPITPKVVGL